MIAFQDIHLLVTDEALVDDVTEFSTQPWFRTVSGIYRAVVPPSPAAVLRFPWCTWYQDGRRWQPWRGRVKRCNYSPLTGAREETSGVGAWTSRELAAVDSHLHNAGEL